MTRKENSPLQERREVLRETNTGKASNSGCPANIHFVREDSIDTTDAKLLQRTVALICTLRRVSQL